MVLDEKVKSAEQPGVIIYKVRTPGGVCVRGVW
jgi:hypothetical protein